MDLGLIERIVGAGHLHTDGAALERCSRDETEDLRFMPDLVVTPGSAREVAEILRYATREKIPVTPRGAGTGLSGGALPVKGGIVLSLSRLNRILEIDRENLMAVVEPGVITQVFQEAVEAQGLFYPPDPASRGSCHLGGNLAHCAGGPRAVKYGVTRDYICGVRAVLPTGEIVHHGGKLRKNSTGYNLTHLLIGSEGTLAVVTELTVRLLALPKHRTLICAPFDDLETPARAVATLFQSGLVPSACEFMERSAVEASEKHLGKTFPHGQAAAHLLLEIDGNDAGEVTRDVERVGEILLAAGARDVLVADSPTRQQELWALRRAMGEAVKKRSIYKEEDTVVPRHALPELIAGVKEIGARYGVCSVCYGHAGDGNVHVNLLKENLSDEKWRSVLPKAIEEIFKHTVALGGTISGEHGIGFSQRAYLPIAHSAEEIALYRRIKAAFDPAGILNPGKIWLTE